MENYLFRASSIGRLMTEPRSKSEGLSATAKEELVKIYLWHRYRRMEEISSKYMDKGNLVEAEAIDIWRRYRGLVVFKNQETLKNEYCSGTPDLIVKNPDGTVQCVPDIKSSWSLQTFTSSRMSSLDKNYYWQGQVYCWLTGAPYAVFCFVLANAPLKLVQDEKYRLARNMGVIDDAESPEFHRKCMHIERNMIYDMPAFLKEYPYANLDTPLDLWTHDIPVAERIHEIRVDFDHEAVEKIKEKAPLWRNYINELWTK